MFILTLLSVFGHAMVRMLAKIYLNKYEKQVISYEEDKPEE
jgi:hypothetical protein